MKAFIGQPILAIVTAMTEELDAILKVVGRMETIDAMDRTFHFRGRICIVQCGIGEIDAASATEAILWFVKSQGGEITQILNVGVVGSLCDDIAVGQAFLVEKAVHYDFDISAVRGRRGQYPDGQLFYAAETTFAEVLGDSVKLATLASGDKFLANKETIRALNDEFDAHICDMEGAAVARVAAQHQIPVTMVKTVSDSGDHDEYKQNLSPTMDSLKEILEIIVKEWQ